jgi:hypothetical protein
MEVAQVRCVVSWQGIIPVVDWNALAAFTRDTNRNVRT